MKLILKEMDGFSQEQQDLINRSVVNAIPVLNWAEWQDEVRNTSFSQTNDSGKQIIDRMINQNEIMIDVTEFHSLSNTIAYTLLKGSIINLNDYFLAEYVKMKGHEGEANVASTLIHEFMHILGYKHSYFWNKKKSVPYKMQYIFYRNYLAYYNKIDTKTLQAIAFCPIVPIFNIEK